MLGQIKSVKDLRMSKVRLEQMMSGVSLRQRSSQVPHQLEIRTIHNI